MTHSREELIKGATSIEWRHFNHFTKKIKFSEAIESGALESRTLQGARLGNLEEYLEEYLEGNRQRPRAVVVISSEPDVDPFPSGRPVSGVVS